MAEYIFKEETLTGLADAFRHKTNTEDKLSVEDMKNFMPLMHYDPNGFIKHVRFKYAETELIKYPVIVGDTCRDVLMENIIDPPTKEPTVSTEYIPNGWSLTDDGTVDDDALTNVTEDRTVYVVFKEEPRKYTVDFYDGETCVHTEQVVYNRSSTYKYTKEGYFFGGWEPAPTNVTDNMRCYAQWTDSVAFSTAAWSEIAWASENGLASQMWSIGDTKFAKIGGVSRQFSIVAFDHDDLADGTGKAGITLMSCPPGYYNLLSANSYPLHSTKTRNDWGSCSFRTTSIPQLLEKTDEDLLAAMKTVNKEYSVYADGAYTTHIAHDKLWIPSCYEVGCSVNKNGGSYVYPELGEKYTSITDATFGLSTQQSLRYYTRNTAGSQNFAVYWDLNASPKVVNTDVVPNSGWTTQAYYVFGFCI